MSLAGCDNSSPHADASNNAKTVFDGATMGTYYRVTIIESSLVESAVGDSVEAEENRGNKEELDEAALRRALENELERMNAIFSSYRDDSELQRFNQMASGDCSVSSEPFVDVLNISRAVNENSNGRFNPAVMPLVRLWGFDREQRSAVPSSEEISVALRAVDFSRVYTSSLSNGEESKHQICKRDAIELDFSAVAKGYAVDHLAGFLKSLGYSRFLIDIGGELLGIGTNSQGQSWKVAIERPEPAKPRRVDSSGIESSGIVSNRLQQPTVEHTVERVLGLENEAIATSGNYRNFFYHDGKRYVHTIDPQTGMPVEHGLLSASVIDPSAAVADAWATALMASGVQRAKRLVLENDLKALLLVVADVNAEAVHSVDGVLGGQSPDHYDQHEQGIVEAGKGDYTVWYPAGFEHYLENG